jgi:hypothetical protein
LESVYLTLMSDATIRQLPSYSQLLLLWNGILEETPGDVGALFYNSVGDRLSVLLPDTLQTLRHGGVNAGFIGSGDTLATNLESIADAIINQPFSTATQAAARSEGVTLAKAEALPPPDALVQVVVTGLAYTAGMLAFGGAVYVLAAAALAGTSITAAALATMTAGVALVGAAFAFNAAVSAVTSTTITVNGAVPGGVPVCTPTGDVEGAFSSEPPDDGLGSPVGPVAPLEPVAPPQPIAPTEPVEPPKPVEPPEPPEPGGPGEPPEPGGPGEPPEPGDPGDPGEDECMAAGTPVLMADGTWKDVAHISTGDQILWIDHITGEKGIAPVIGVRATVKRPTWHVGFDDGTFLHTSASHPFFRAGSSDTVRASALSPGDRVAALAGEKKVEKAVRTGRSQTVFNLDVGGRRRFIVGPAEVVGRPKL